MIKAYDFKSPKKFTKERMSTVENLYDSFSRSLAPYLTGLLQSYCEISINGIQEMRFQEYTVRSWMTVLCSALLPLLRKIRITAMLP